LKRVIAIAAMLGSACSLVVGTETYTLGDAGGDDATAPEASSDAPQPPDDAGSDASCTAIACVAEAGVCGSNCGQATNTCLQGCKTQMCKDNCNATDNTCRSSCNTACFQCSVNASCPDPTGCFDASHQ